VTEQSKRPWVQDMVAVHLIPELRWCHTHGLAAHGLPELEVRDVSPLFLSAAGVLLNRVAEYLLENPPGHVKLGQTMETDRFTVFRFEKLEPIAPDQAEEYADERWCLVAVEGAVRCACCDKSIGSQEPCAHEHEPPKGGSLH